MQLTGCRNGNEMRNATCTDTQISIEWPYCSFLYCGSSDINMRIMIIEIKYFSTNNTVLHTENCKLQLDLNCSPRELRRLIVQQCGISDSPAKRGFSDHALEIFYVDYIEPGNPKKAPFVLRTNEQMAMLRESKSRSLFIRVIQRLSSFQKGTINIVFENSLDPSPTSSSTASVATTSTSNVEMKSVSKKSKKVTKKESSKELPLADDGKSMCCFVAKNQKWTQVQDQTMAI